MKRKLLLFFCLSMLGVSSSFAQAGLLAAGPMAGYSEMREVMLWVQTKGPAKVRIKYWEPDKPSFAKWTNEVQTEKHKAYTAHLLADEVDPGKKYTYALYLNDNEVQLSYPLSFQSQELWQYRKDPPPVTFALGSCTFINDSLYDRPGKPYGHDPVIFESLYKEKPDFMVWLGDNTYFRPADWNSRTGILYRNSHTRQIPQLQPLLGSTHHFAIWDDHDFGPNDSDRSFLHKDLTLEAFKLFWANPSYGLPGSTGITSYFTWADLDFFLLDNRYFRTPNDRETGEHTVLGEQQVTWLIDALKNSRAPFKFVCMGGQMLNTTAKYENYINLAPKERAYILKAIQDEKIEGVIFVDGDRHHSEISVLNEKGQLPVYDITSSPLTATAYDASKEPNTLRIKESIIGEQNYAICVVEGPRTDRVLTIRFHDKQGKELWRMQLKARDLRADKK